MPRREIGRYLTLLRSLWRDFLFRSVVAGTSLIVAAIFATRPIYQQHQESRSSTYADQKTPDKVDNNGFFGIGPDAWTAIFTGVLTIFTGLLVTTGYIQIRYLIRADETGRRSADAAKQSADVAAQALRGLQRSFLIFNDSYLENPPDRSVVDAFHIYGAKIQNVGGSAALRVKHKINWIFTVDPIPDEFVFPDLELPSPTSIFIAANNHVMSDFLTIPTFFIREVFEGRGNLYFYGWTEYDDVFDGTSRHRTEFCFFLRKLRILGDREGNASFGIHHHHNGTDESCQKPLQT